MTGLDAYGAKVNKCRNKSK